MRSAIRGRLGLGVALLLLGAAGCTSTPTVAPPDDDTAGQAEREFLAGRYARAAQLYEQLLARSPSVRRAEVLAQVGKCRLGAGEAEGAVRAFTEALAAGPPPGLKAEIHYRRAAAHNALWRPGEALADLKRVGEATEAVRDSAVKAEEYLYRLAVTTMRAGDWAAGRKLLADVAAKHAGTREATDAKDRLGLKEFRIQVARVKDPKGATGDAFASAAGDYLVLTGRFPRFADAVREMERLRASGHPDAFIVP